MMLTANPIAVLVAAFSSVVASAIWYSPMLFGKQWSHLSRVNNDSPERKKAFPGLIARMFIAALVTAYVLALILNQTMAAQPGLLSVLCAATLVWVGFIASRLYVSYSFDDQPLGLILINVGNELVGILAMAFFIWLI
jgi:fatty acid desaturase